MILYFSEEAVPESTSAKASVSVHALGAQPELRSPKLRGWSTGMNTWTSIANEYGSDM